MIQKIKRFVVSLVIAGAIILPASPALAIDVFQPCNGGNNSAVCGATDDNATSMISIIVDTLIYLLGAISVVMIVVGGIRFVTSNGDSSGVKSARETVLYSVVGLLVAIMSFAIVKFVIGRF